MLDRYDGSYVLATAAYNAGPGRVDEWLEKIGDPREPGIDAVGWIEAIPFTETRNYVMRVLEALHVYRARLAATGPYGSPPTSARAPRSTSRPATSRLSRRPRSPASIPAPPLAFARQAGLAEDGVEAGGEDQRGAGDGPGVGALAEEREAEDADEDELEVGEGLDGAGLGDLVDLDQQEVPERRPMAQRAAIQHQSGQPWIGVHQKGATRVIATAPATPV